jgi:hypothetical protein
VWLSRGRPDQARAAIPRPSQPSTRLSWPASSWPAQPGRRSKCQHRAHSVFRRAASPTKEPGRRTPATESSSSALNGDPPPDHNLPAQISVRVCAGRARPGSDCYSAGIRLWRNAARANSQLSAAATRTARQEKQVLTVARLRTVTIYLRSAGHAASSGLAGSAVMCSTAQWW